MKHILTLFIACASVLQAQVPVKVSELTTATTLNGADLVPLVQSGATKKITGTNLASALSTLLSLDSTYAAQSHTHSFSSLIGKPTTLSGYGITDAIPATGSIGSTTGINIDITNALDLHAPLSSPTFTNGVTLADTGLFFTGDNGTATLSANPAMAADVTILLPATAGTLVHSDDVLTIIDDSIGDTLQAHSGALDAIAAGTWTGASSITTLGTIATGVWSGTTIAVANGGTGATTAANARTNLGLVVGTDVQAYNASLAAIAGGTWTGASSITTLGTISTGVWSGTAITPAKGGTGLTSVPLYAVPYGVNSSTMAYATSSAADRVLITTGLGAPSFGQVDLASGMTTGSLALSRLAQGSATSGQVLSWNGSAWAPASVSSGLTVGTTSVASGTNGYVLYNNSGTLGQYAIGTDLLAVSGSAAQTITLTSLGTTPTAALSLINSTAASSGSQQVSPSTVWQGQGWKTASTAASQAVAFKGYTLPVQGSSAPTGTWNLDYSINGGAYASAASISTAGVLTLGASTALYPNNGGVNEVFASAATMRIGTGVVLMGFIYPANSPGAGSFYSDGTGNICMRGSYAPTQAQDLTIYNTYTSSVSYERAEVGWNATSNVFVVGTQKGASGGTARDMSFVTDATERLRLKSTGEFLFSSKAAPSSASDTGVANEIRFDANYIYFCTATNTWKRAALSTW